MMRLAGASNCPANFESIKRILMPKPSSTMPLHYFFICRTCSTISYSQAGCPNAQCQQFNTFSQPPFECMVMPIVAQLRDILLRGPNLNMNHQNESRQLPHDEKIRDIYDGEVYQRVLMNENGHFLSLTMNIDGIQVAKSSSNSLWIVTFAINEIRRSERFKMKNIIIGGIISSTVKPSHKHINAFLEPMVKELVQLEKGEFFEVKNLNVNQLMFFKIFLICCCADKPAQSLIQGVSEPTGAYGCGRCELQGKFSASLFLHGCSLFLSLGVTVEVKNESNKKIRVFPLLSADQPQPRIRTNKTYDEFINIGQKERASTAKALRDQMKGQIAACPLRDLSYFDVGSCFASDSLHNIYQGVVVSCIERGSEHQLISFRLG